MRGPVRSLALGAVAIVLWCACKQEPASPTTSAPKAAAAALADAAAPTAPAAPAARVAAVPPKLYDHPVERRLHSARVETSSFLWTDWNKFQENYHPSYLLDGDPTTAWVEGADGSGVGQWVRVHVSRVIGATQVRLRIWNGYQKSPALHAKNARLHKLEVVLLPGGQTRTVELKDAMGWQELVLEGAAEAVEAIELRALAVYEGSKYTDLCVSDLEIYVTGLNVENPAFEKGKLEELLAWKKKRLEAAAIFGGKQAATLPVLPGYRVLEAAAAPEVPRNRAKLPNEGLLTALDSAQKAAGGKLDILAPRAATALASDFKGWVPVKVVARPPLELPEVDGLTTELTVDGMQGMPSHEAFFVPSFAGGGVLLQSGHLSVFDSKAEGSLERGSDRCKPDRSAFLRPPRGSDEGPLVRELLLVRCVSWEDREASGTTATWVLLEFDDEGRLGLMVGPRPDVAWLEWEKRLDRPVLAGGQRVEYPGHEMLRLSSDAEVALP